MASAPSSVLRSLSSLSLLPHPIARRVSGTRGVAKESSVTVNTVRPFYGRLPRPTFEPTVSVVPRNKLPATKALAAGTRLGASAPRKPSPPPLHACARADYKQIPGFAFANTRIPRPARAALKTAPVRPALGIRVRMADVARHLKAKRMLLSVEQPQEVAACAEKVLARGQDVLVVPVHSVKETTVEPQCQGKYCLLQVRYHHD